MQNSVAVLPKNAKKETVGQLSFPSEWTRTVTLALTQAAVCQGAEMTAVQLDLYRRLLAGVPAEELLAAIERCLRQSAWMPKPAEILAACGRSPEALADAALADALAWVREWGPSGRTVEPGQEQIWEMVIGADGVRRAKAVPLRFREGPRLPERTMASLRAIACDPRRGLERLLGSAEDSERYARFRREFVNAWKEAK